MAFEPSKPLLSTCFFYWKDHYPELQVLLDNFDAILEESKDLGRWVPWPEDHFSINPEEGENTRDWTVCPLLYTFPAYDPTKSKWVESTCSICPKTVQALKSLGPLLRTALFSRLGPGTKLSTHTGWADLANHVLRVHLCLDIPVMGSCGLLVDGEVQYHKQGKILVFDDSKPHRAFNLSEGETRTVLIVDLERPKYLPLGTATGQHTPELDHFVSWFK
eukprot:gene1883-2060_t